MPFDEHERRTVRAWAAHVQGKIPLVLETTRDRRSGVLQTFAQELTAVAPQIVLDLLFRENDDPPAFFPGHGWIWHAAPTGAELRPFLEILDIHGERSASSRKPADAQEADSRKTVPNLRVSPQLASLLETIQSPRELAVFTTPQCPHCAHMLLELAPIPFVAPYLVIRVFDATLFPERAHAAGIRSVPTVLFGDDFRWTGRVDIQHIFEVVCRGEHTALSAAAAIRVLKEGKAHELARLMLASPTMWNDFTAVLSHPDWSVRLGALVVLEELAEKDPAKAGAYLPVLWEKMEALPTPVQGDVLYATGIVGDALWKDKVVQWMETRKDDPDLREVAEETLKKLEAAGCR
ncbi:MAG: hypothetical protein WHS86_08880 [Desulfosoma sp.]